jgi:peptide/nickel transport system permease protein
MNAESTGMRGPFGAMWVSIRQGIGLLLRRKSAAVGAFFLVTLVFVAIFADFLAPYAPDTYTDANSQSPSWAHPFGIDHLGRDIMSRVIYGARISLRIGILAVSISVTIGTAIGLISGYFGGLVDGIIMRLMDIMLALPYILLAVLITAALGPSLENGILAIGIVRIPRFARLARGSTLSVKTLTFIDASRAVGAPSSRILLRDVLPNIAGPLIVYSTLSLGDAILSAAVLSFLGLGAQPPIPEWGAMLNDAQEYLISYPYMSIFPGLAIFFTVLAFNLIGDGVRDILDPKTRR